jgi:hypothetical protein
MREHGEALRRRGTAAWDEQSRRNCTIEAIILCIAVRYGFSKGRFAFEELAIFIGRFSLRRRGYPAWIRTKNNASKGRCVTVTPRGN